MLRLWSSDFLHEELCEEWKVKGCLSFAIEESIEQLKGREVKGEEEWVCSMI